MDRRRDYPVSPRAVRADNESSRLSWPQSNMPQYNEPLVPSKAAKALRPRSGGKITQNGRDIWKLCRF